MKNYDRKAERTAKFNKRKQSKNRSRSKGYKKEQLQEEDLINDFKNWKNGLSRDSDRLR